MVVRLRGTDAIILAGSHRHGDVERPLRRLGLQVPFVIRVVPELLDFEYLGVNGPEDLVLQNFVDVPRSWSYAKTQYL